MIDVTLTWGICCNRVIGATDEKQFCVPIQPGTLACNAEKGIRVRPEHINTELRVLAGIADHPSSGFLRTISA